MKILTRALALCLLIGAIAASSTAQPAQRLPPDAEVARAIVIFAELLHDEQGAKTHVGYLLSYMQKSPWEFSTLVEITQRLTVASAVRGHGVGAEA
jgi:hypothetical protein